MYKNLSQSELDAIERRLLIEMGKRYGRTIDAAKEARENGRDAAIREAKANAREAVA